MSISRPDKNQISLIGDTKVVQELSHFLHQHGKIKWHDKMQYNRPPGQLLSWLLELSEDPALGQDSAPEGSNLAQPLAPKTDQSQEVQTLWRQVEQLQQQVQMLLPSDDSPKPEPTPNDNNQELLDNNESEISQPVPPEETLLDRDSDV